MNLLRRQKKYKPPKKVEGFDDIRTGQIMVLWNDIRPSPSRCQIGERVKIPMKSGNLAVYELIDVDYLNSVDWNWYTLRFVGYNAHLEEIFQFRNIFVNYLLKLKQQRLDLMKKIYRVG